MLMRKKILVLTSTFPRQPDDTDPPFVYELTRRLVRHYAVTVMCPHARGLPIREMLHDVAVRRFRYCISPCETLAYGTGILNKLRKNKLLYLIVPFFILAEIFAVAWALRKERFLLINAHWVIPQGLVAVLAGMITGSSVPIVCTLHGGDVFALKRFDWLKRFVLDRCDAIIAVSTAIRDYVVSMGIEESRICVIPMGVDLKTLFVPPDNDERVRGGLVFVGRLVEKKGLRYLIEALSEVVDKHENITLSIYGSGPEEYAIKKMIAAYRLDGRVRMYGPVSNSTLPEIYRSSALMVFPSIVDAAGDTEGFGLVLVEALGCGCPVIASALPPVRDIIEDGRTGILVQPENAAALAEKISLLLDAPDERKRLAAQGRQHVVERFDWETTVRGYTGIMDKFMQQEGGNDRNGNQEPPL